MPAKKQITKQQIFDAALDMLSTQGSASLNARALAKKLGCSTQPIYLAYSGMNELSAELLVACKNVLGEYLAQEKRDGIFLSQFVGYVRFAYEKPNLFKFVYFDNKYANTEADRAYVEHTVEAIMKAGGYDKNTATRFYFEAWMVMHGVASQLAFGFSDMNWDEVMKLAVDQFEALKQYHGKNANKQ